MTGTTSVPVDLLPSTAGTINLGSATVPFEELFLAGTSGTPGSNNFKITGAATAARTITFPDATGTVCLTTGNCAGAGGGITGSGTNGTLAKFTGTGTIGNSLLSESGSLVTVNGSLTVNTNQIITGTLTSGAINGLTLTSNATGFQIAGGTSSKTLVLADNATLNQNLRTTDSPTFAGLTLGSGTLQGTTAVIDFTNFDVSSGGNVTAAGTLAIQGASVTVGGCISGRVIILNDGSGQTATIQIGDLAADRTLTVPVATSADTFCLQTLANCMGGAGGSAPANAQYLTLALDSNLTAERLLSPGTSLSVTDGGANGNYSINTIQDIRTSASPQFTNLTLTGT